MFPPATTTKKRDATNRGTRQVIVRSALSSRMAMLLLAMGTAALPLQAQADREKTVYCKGTTWIGVENSKWDTRRNWTYGDDCSPDQSKGLTLYSLTTAGNDPTGNDIDDLHVSGLVFDGQMAYGITVSGEELEVGANGILNNSEFQQILDVDIEIKEAQTWATATGDLMLRGDLDGKKDLIKSGTGKLTIAGDGEDYKGDITVAEGTLNVDGRLSKHTDVTVRDGGVLSGIGRIGGAVTVEEGGLLSPGSSPGLLTLDDDLILQEGSIFRVEFGLEGENLVFDRVMVHGDVFLAGILELVLLDPVPADFFAAGDLFQILNWDGDISGGFSAIKSVGFPFSELTWSAESLPADGSVTLAAQSTAGGGGISSDAVPEPRTPFLLGLGIVVLGLTYQRRKP